MKATLVLEDNTRLEGMSFGYPKSAAGEIVFTTGMVGYPESLTDPSFAGQILVFTYPLAGSYGVPDRKFWESKHIQTTGLIVSNYIDTPSHYHSQKTLGEWLNEEKIPALQITDTRLLAQKIRDRGAMLAKIEFPNKPVPWFDPNKTNLVAQVAATETTVEGKGKKTVVVIDCGGKRMMIEHLLQRGVRVISVPWDQDLFAKNIEFDGILISNGPGDPKAVDFTIKTVKTAMSKKIPIFGICLGHQILTLAAGGDTYKMKFGHRGQNQPCLQVGTKRCYLTTQNHGFAVNKLPDGFREWFINANDNTNEGIIHNSLPFMSVQFHPEVTPGPMDTDWLFDYFLKYI